MEKKIVKKTTTKKSVTPKKKPVAKKKFKNKYARAWIKSQNLQFKNTEELNEKIGEYLDSEYWDISNFPKVYGLQTHLGISRQNVYDWTKLGKDNKKYKWSYIIREAYKTISMIIDDIAMDPELPREKINYIMYYKRSALKEFDRFIETTKQKLVASVEAKVENDVTPTEINIIAPASVPNLKGASNYSSIVSTNELLNASKLKLEKEGG